MNFHLYDLDQIYVGHLNWFSLFAFSFPLQFRPISIVSNFLISESNNSTMNLIRFNKFLVPNCLFFSPSLNRFFLSFVQTTTINVRNDQQVSHAILLSQYIIQLSQYCVVLSMGIKSGNSAGCEIFYLYLL